MATTSTNGEVLLELQNVVKAYGAGRKAVRRGQRCQSDALAGRVYLPAWSFGLRQVHAAADHHRLESRHLGNGALSRSADSKASIRTPRSSSKRLRLYPWLTVKDNVQIALKARGVEPAARAERALKTDRHRRLGWL